MPALIPLPFNHITTQQLAQIGILSDEVRRVRSTFSETGFYSIDDMLNMPVPEVEIQLEAKIAKLSDGARIELIALLFFARRINRNPKYFYTDLRSAQLQLNNPNVFETDNLGDYIRIALRSLSGF